MATWKAPASLVGRHSYSATQVPRKSRCGWWSSCRLQISSTLYKRYSLPETHPLTLVWFSQWTCTRITWTLWLLYNVALVSAVKQSESAICIHISPPAGTSSPSPHPTLPGHHRAPKWAPGVTQQPPTICYTHSRVYMSIPTSQLIPPSPYIHSFFSHCQSLIERHSSLEQWFSQCDWWKETRESLRPLQGIHVKTLIINNTKKLFTFFYWVTFANVVKYI